MEPTEDISSMPAQRGHRRSARPTGPGGVRGNRGLQFAAHRPERLDQASDRWRAVMGGEQVGFTRKAVKPA